MKLKFVLLGIMFAIGSTIPLFYFGCGVQNPNEPNWGYPTSTPILPPANTATPNPSVTPVPTLPGSIFNSGASVLPWSINTGSSTEGNTSGTAMGFNSSFSGCSTFTGAMEITIGFTGPQQAVYVQDTLSSVVNLSGLSIKAILEVNGGWNGDSEQVYGAIFIQENVSPYAAIYQNGTAFCSSSCPANSSGCVTLTLTIPSSTTAVGSYSGYNVYNGPYDPTQTQIVGLQLGTGNSGTGFSSTIIDVQSWLY